MAEFDGKCSFHSGEIERILQAQVVAVRNEARNQFENCDDPEISKAILRSKLDMLEQISVAFGIELDIPKTSRIKLLFDWVWSSFKGDAL